MKLYAFHPNGHGPLSFFVCAENEEAARTAVDQRVAAIGRDQYEVQGWGTDRYRLSVFEPGQVEQHENE